MAKCGHVATKDAPEPRPAQPPETGRVVAVPQTIPTPSSPRTGGAEYVWHCHILEHQEHDMMRPLVVI